MTVRLYDKLFRPTLALIGVLLVLSVAPSVHASPFGQGVFGAHVLFGSATSMTISLGSNVNISLTPSGSTFVGTGSHVITVTSTDVEGYSLYIWGNGTTNMVSGSDTIAASSNSTAGALANNTWGYNITGSTSNFIGLTTRPAVLKTASGPYYDAPDTTTVTYGVITDITKAEGTYTATTTYTAVALNQ